MHKAEAIFRKKGDRGNAWWALVDNKPLIDWNGRIRRFNDKEGALKAATECAERMNIVEMTS